MIDRIPDSIHIVEVHVQQMKAFISAVEDLQSWVSGTSDVIQQRHAQSATSPDEQDSIIVDPQVHTFFEPDQPD